MTFFFMEFSLLLLFLFCAFILAILVFFVAYVFTTFKAYPEKLAPYECGFDPFEDARNAFEVRFYLVAILFLVFDLEASFLFPWAVNVSSLGSDGFWVVFDFFVELVVGFFYAWKQNAFEWSN